MRWAAATVSLWLGAITLLGADAIDDLRKEFEGTRGLWRNGSWLDIKRPQSASPEELLKAGVENPNLTYLSGATMIMHRKIEIKDSLPKEYTVIVFSTKEGKQMMLAFFAGSKDVNLWLVRLFMVRDER